jgi:predicted RNA methylase
MKMGVMRRLIFVASVAVAIAIVVLLNPPMGNTQEGGKNHTIGKTPDTARLRQLALKILDTRHPPHSLRPEVTKLAQLLDSCATVKHDKSKDISDGETLTKNGLAISPVMAAMCVQDFARTVVFIRGLHSAIQDSRSRFLDRQTRVLYAGCGPYAILAVPSMAVFSPQDVRFTILDIHKPSVESAKSVVNTLGLAEYVASYEVIDAMHYQVRRDEKPDVTVMEIMNACLEKEPQVAVTRHLFDQAPRMIIVPESVRVDANLVDVSKEFTFVDPQRTVTDSDRDRIFLGMVFELSRETVKLWKSEGNARLPAASIKIPDPLEKRYSPMLFTTIRVYKEHRLKEYDSGLTVPRPFPRNGPIRGGDTLKFYYRLGSHPALMYDSVGQSGRKSME